MVKWFRFEPLTVFLADQLRGTPDAGDSRHGSYSAGHDVCLAVRPMFYEVDLTNFY